VAKHHQFQLNKVFLIVLKLLLSVTNDKLLIFALEGNVW